MENEKEEYIKKEIESAHRLPSATLDLVLDFVYEDKSLEDMKAKKQKFFELLKGTLSEELLTGFWRDKHPEGNKNTVKKQTGKPDREFIEEGKVYTEDKPEPEDEKIDFKPYTEAEPFKKDGKKKKK